MNSRYVIRWATGRRTPCAAWADVEAAIRADFPDADAGHPGDLSDGGDRTLVWACPTDAVNDDGARAVASIVRGAL